jgi:hypothetical protein
VADVTLDVTVTNRYTRYGVQDADPLRPKKQKQELKGGMIEGIAALQPSR